jgi:hypothetical protein
MIFLFEDKSKVLFGNYVDEEHEFDGDFNKWVEKSKFEQFQKFGVGLNTITTYKNQKKMHIYSYLVEMKIEGEPNYIFIKEQRFYIDFLQKYIPLIESLHNLHNAT